jgi:SAM-dependent methyltransferase
VIADKMQKEKTIEFWNKFHQQESSKEWILKPSKALFDVIPLHGRVLEIGCGTSHLSRDLYLFGNETCTSFVATDVSAVCIQSNQKRDETLLAASKGKFSYQVLDVLEPDQKLVDSSNVILDKGCFDTFLFRSGHQVSKQLVKRLLDNIHRWLKDGGKYIVLTPRSKLKLLRDYDGFSSVKRTVMDESNDVVLGDLDGSGGSDAVYMYVCDKDCSYSPGNGVAFRDKYDISLQSEDHACSSCGLSFRMFRNGEDMSGKGINYWSRRWRGHCVHCRGQVT